MVVDDDLGVFEAIKLALGRDFAFEGTGGDTGGLEAPTRRGGRRLEASRQPLQMPRFSTSSSETGPNVGPTGLGLLIIGHQALESRATRRLALSV